MTDATEGVSSTTEVSIRRAPKVSVFLVVGALLGALVTLIVTALQPADPKVGFAALFGYFCVYGVPLGAVVGGFIAVLLDRRATRNASRLTAERVNVDEPDANVEPDAN